MRKLVRRKLDAEEIKEIKSKSEARRRKAYENYEESCKPKGKFTARSCPILADCYTKNKLPYVPVATKPQMTTAVALTSTALVPRPAVKPKGICSKSIWFKLIIIDIIKPVDNLF